jgi:hypothetical protein
VLGVRLGKVMFGFLECQCPVFAEVLAKFCYLTPVYCRVNKIGIVTWPQ